MDAGAGAGAGAVAGAAAGAAARQGRGAKSRAQGGGRGPGVPVLHPLALACLLAAMAPSAWAANCTATDQTSLANCIAGANAGEIVTLGNDISFAGPIPTLNNGATINANGHVLSGAGSVLTLGNGIYSSFANTTLGTDSLVFSGTTGTLQTRLGATLTLTGNLTINAGATANFGYVPGSAGSTINIATSSANGTNTSNIAIKSGNTVIDNGSLASLAAIAASTTTELASTLQFNGSSAAVINNLQGTGGTIVMSNGMTLLSGNYSGNIQGSGDLTKSGAGTLILGGSNGPGGTTYTGNTLITGGILRTSNANVLPTGTAVSLSNNAILDLNGFNQSIATLSGGAATSIILGSANLTTNQATGTSFYDGIISGNLGSLTKTGAGKLVLSGDNTYSGLTTIGAGGSLQLGNGGVTGSLGTGAIVNNGTLLVDRLNGAVLSNNISGTGALLQAGVGALTLLGTNTYTGTTNVAIGTTLQAGAANTFSAASATRLGAGATLNLNNFDQSIGSLASAGAGAATSMVTLGSATLTAGGDNSSTLFSGVISGNGGGLTKTGTGTLTLTGTNTYSGTTTISAGTLQVGNGGSSGSLGTGNVVDNGTLAFNLTGSNTLANAISGSGNLVQSAGTLFLTGSNAYTGTTTIDSGATLSVGNSSLSGSLGIGAVTNNGALAFSRSNPLTVSNDISGTGSVTQAGGSITTLTGTNTYSGATSVNNGTLRAGATNSFSSNSAFNVAASTTLDVNGFNQTIGSLAGAGSVILGSATLTAGGDNSSTLFSGVISGNGGGLTKTGTGTLTLTGTNTYSGTTTISDGTLQMGNGGATGTLGTGAIVDNGTLKINRSSNLVMSNDISGAGSLVVSGSGILRLTGNNVYTGTTTVDAGSALQVGIASAGTLGTGNVVNNGTLYLGRDDAVTVSNDISGSGGLISIGAGITTLSGNNTYTGSTSILSGTLRAGAVNVLGANSVNSAVSFGANTTLDLNNFNQSIGALVSSVATATLSLGSALLAINQTSDQIFAGTITGTGGITKAGASKLTLSGTNTYSGTTTISAGTLQVGNGGTTGTLGDGTGAVINNGALAFKRSDAATVANAISGSGALTQSGSGTLILTGANAYTGTTTISTGTLQVGDGGTTGTLGDGTGAVINNSTLAFKRSDAATVANAISGSGALTQSGSGTLILTGTNTYSGTTTISAGTLQVGNGGTTGTLGDGTGAVINNGTLAFKRSDAATVATTISGSGALTQSGSGTLILTGANTYSGTTTISTGTLQVGDGGTTGTLGDGTGAVINNGALVLNLSNTYTVANAIGGSGSLTDNSSAVMILTGNNTYTGTTTINAGLLQVGNGGASGSLGTGDVLLDNAAALAFNRSSAMTVTNNISGLGRLYQNGTGVLTLTGNNSYTGITTVAGGASLQVGNGGTTGTLGSNGVTNNGTLIFNRSDAVTVANTISGTGALTKEGAGNLILTSLNNTYTGPTTVNAGTLSVNGTITSAVTVNNGATLGGTGTVGNTTVASGGTLAPGNSIGNLNVNGNLTFSNGSTFRVETIPGTAPNSSDSVQTLGAGTVTINGGTVDVQAGGTAYARNTTYTIITSAGARTGAFNGATSNLVFLTPTLSYDANHVYLSLANANAPVSYGNVATTGNQANVANYLSSFANNPGNAQAAALIQRIDNLTAEQARLAFTSMSGAQHAGASQVGQAMTGAFGNALNGHINGAGGDGNSFNGVGSIKGSSFALSSPATLWGVSGDTPAQMAAMFASSGANVGSASTLNGVNMGSNGSSTSDSGAGSNLGLRDTGRAASGEAGFSRGTWGNNVAGQNGLWGQALGAGGKTRSDGNGAGTDYRAGGFLVGYDKSLSTNWLVGVAGGYSRANWDASINGVAPANGKVETPQGAVYARYSSGPVMLSFAGSYADQKFSTNRTVTIGTANSVAASEHHGQEWGLNVQAEYALAAGSWQLRPLAGIRYAHLREDGFTESGATPGANLSVDARTTENTTVSTGLRVLRAFNQSAPGNGGFELRAIYSHLFGNNDSPITARLAGQSASFTATGTPLKRDAITFGAGVATKLGRNFTGFIDASYEARGSGQNAYAIGAGAKYQW